jgi:hypothetical protein
MYKEDPCKDIDGLVSILPLAKIGSEVFPET